MLSDTYVVVQELVTLSFQSFSTTPTNSVLVEWIAAPDADLIADAIVSLIQQAFSATSMIRMLSRQGLGQGNEKKRGGSSGNTEENKLNVLSAEDELLKKIRMGLVDPSRAIPSQLLDKSVDSEDKLRRICEALQASRLFSSVQLDRSLHRLIIRGKAPDNSGTKSNEIGEDEEAFVLIYFTSNHKGAVKEESIQPKHHAVVKCESEIFRNLVISSLSQLDNLLNL